MSHLQFLPMTETTRDASRNGPIALDLNDDTLLESIEFSKSNNEKLDNSALPPELAHLKPDEQPQLNALGSDHPTYRSYNQRHLVTTRQA